MPRALSANAEGFYYCLTINLMAALGILCTPTAYATGTKPQATQSLWTWLLNSIAFASQPHVLLMVHRLGAPTHIRACHIQGQCNTAFLSPQKFWPKRYFLSSFAMGKQKQKKAQARIYARCLMHVMSSAFLSILQASVQPLFPLKTEGINLDWTSISLIELSDQKGCYCSATLSPVKHKPNSLNW